MSRKPQPEGFRHDSKLQDREDYSVPRHERFLGIAEDKEDAKRSKKGIKSRERQGVFGNEKKGAEKKPKNQAEITHVRNENEKIKAENEKAREVVKQVKEALDGALKLVFAKRKGKQISDSEKTRLAVISQRVTVASNGLEQFKLQRDVVINGVLQNRTELIEVQDLMSACVRDVEALKSQVEEVGQITALAKEANSEVLDGDGKKAKWRKKLQGVKNIKIKAKIIARMQEWQQLDEARGAKYDKNYEDSQLGEACFQVFKEYSQDQLGRFEKIVGEKNKEIEKFKKYLKTIDDSSINYFQFHFKKAVKELNALEQSTQDYFNKEEAGNIAIVENYRKLILEEYESELPENFNDLNKRDQDLILAKLAFENRILLNFPEEKALLPDLEPVYDEVVKVEQNINNGSKIDVSRLENYAPVDLSEFAPKEEEHILQNTNPPYDIENLAFSLPEIPKGIDKRIFLIDISAIAERMARSKAEERFTKEFDKKGGFFGAVKNAWKGLSENHKRIKYYQEAITEIQTDNNLMRAISERVSGQPVPGGGTRISAEYLQILGSVVEEYKHEVADAQREVGDSLKDDPEIKGKFAELLHRYRTNKWDGAAYQGLDKRASVELYVKEKIAPYINKQSTAKWTQDIDRLKEAKGLLYASNFYEMLESIDNQYKGQIDQAVKELMEKNPEANIEAIREAIASHVEGVQGLDLKLGLKERDLVNNRPKGILNVYERMVNFGEKHTVLGKVVMNPFVIGAAATLAGNGVQRAIKWAAVGGAVAAGASGFWVPLGVGAMAGGAYRAFKRSKDVKYDTAQELRHQTLGGKPSEVLGVSNERNYGTAIMAFSEALLQVGAMKGKTSFTDIEKQQLAQIYARLQLEHDTLVSNKKEEFKLDLFKTDEESGKKYGTIAVEKSKLKVELKKLGITETDLQTLIDQEKVNLVKLIADVNKEQDSFRRKEMLKSGAMGAVMGVAGGVIGQQASYELGRLFGSEYMNTHGTMLEKVLGFKHGLFGNAGGDKIISPATIVPGSGLARSSTEWFHNMRGHISGGEVDTIHTQNWYDNPDMSDPHVHNRNELQFHISKDASEALHFKVPVEDNNSWLIHSKTLNFADVTKAFADGRIKMIFVPDGAHPESAVVLDVDPTTKEVVIPKGSNLRGLFDEKTGRPKGTGFFGLAERQGTSKNYIWINSERNNGQNIDWGKTSGPGKVVPAEFGKGDVEDFDNLTIPTVPPERKVFMRPEERAKFEEQKKQKEVGEAGDSALPQGRAEVLQGRNRVNFTQETHNNSELSEAGEAKLEQRLREENKDLINPERITQLRRTYQLDLSPEQKKSFGINFQIINDWQNFEDNAIKKAKEADKKELHAKYGKELKGHHHEHEDDVKYVVIHYEGPATQEYIAELKKLNESVATIENKYKRIEELNKSIKKILIEEDTEYEGDIDDLTQEFEDLTENEWDKDFDLVKYRKNYRSKLRKISNEKEAQKTTASAPAPAKPEQPKDKIPEGTFKTESGSTNEADEFGKLTEVLIQSTGHRVHFNENGEQVPDAEKVKTVKVFQEALNLLSKEDRNKILGKYNSKHKGTPFARGIIIGFPTSVSRLEFSKNDDTLRIPANITAEQLKEFLLEGYKKTIERRQARLEQQRASEGVTEGKPVPGVPKERPPRTYAKGRVKKTE